MSVSTKILTNDWPQLYCDGACRGNPGPAAVGSALFAANKKDIIFEISQIIGKATNNIAEYTALILGLEKSLEHKIQYLQIFLDSELVVRQITGVYRVKKPAMRPLYAQAKDFLKELNSYTIAHVPREKNSHADALANKALDEMS